MKNQQTTKMAQNIFFLAAIVMAIIFLLKKIIVVLASQSVFFTMVGLLAVIMGLALVYWLAPQHVEVKKKEEHKEEEISLVWTRLFNQIVIRKKGSTDPIFVFTVDNAVGEAQSEGFELVGYDGQATFGQVVQLATVDAEKEEDEKKRDILDSLNLPRDVLVALVANRYSLDELDGEAISALSSEAGAN